jgi:hypothetical protein
MILNQKPDDTTMTKVGALGPRKPVAIPRDAVWITAAQVCSRYGGRSFMWLSRKLQNDPSFPRPSYDGRIRLFRLSEFDQYDQSMIAAQLKRAG